ncbi:MAG: NAD-dependent malic enzyme [Elusimicrobia bacterium]|nr:NAD-dependent malic enzyme [Elusimicrobiota bacterium]MDE2425237.1 NAD-dependent malic enzyme [Elusimicrobiota bacterium]
MPLKTPKSHKARKLSKRPPLPTGLALMQDPLLNKGTCFTLEERRRLGLLGLLPPRVSSPEQQLARALGNIRQHPNDLLKYVEMISLMDRNESLFFRVVIDNIEEMMPIIYTPVVGQACQLYSHIYRRARGIYLSQRERGMFKEVLRNWPVRDVRVIVVTDGERILGLGDLGASGMGIPVGKLSLYTACAGVHPAQTLPVTLDVGTNNESLLNDPLYLGLPQRRLTGAAYDELVDEFVRAARSVFPKALIQFEDFANRNAFRLLEKYRRDVCCFNDDIQGTAAVTLAGLYSACRLTKARLRDQTVLFYGAGEAAIGTANLIVAAMTAEGMPRNEAMRRCWFMDSKALVESSRTDLQPHKKPYAHEHAPLKDLLGAVRALKPTALIGASGHPGQFTREIIEELGRLNAVPVIFALSNPTSKAECTAEQAYSWTGGRALFASGSPFAPVRFEGRTLVPGQGNNAYIFPGVGLGVVASSATRVTDEMFFEASKILAGLVTEGDLSSGCLYPPLSRIREVSARIAAKVCEVAYTRGLAREPKPKNLLAHVRALQYQPTYKSYV